MSRTLQSQSVVEMMQGVERRREREMEGSGDLVEGTEGVVEGGEGWYVPVRKWVFGRWP